MRPRPAETAALGLLQGPAELLPVSSSAHIELLPWALGWAHARLPGAARKEVEVALHFGTAVALAARPRLWFAALTVAPAAVLGLLLEGPIERRLGGPRSIAAGLIAGSAALVASDRGPASRAAADAGPRDALLIGLAQAAALWPGVSRSAATRSAARALGFSRAAAAELSAEAALPVLVGASVLKGARILRRGRPEGALLAGAAAAAVSTRAALRITALQRIPPAVWAAYRCALAAAVLSAAPRDRAAVSPRGAAESARRPPLPPQSVAVSGAYAQSGVDTGAADRAVGALVSVLRTIDTGKASRSVLESGHYAAVLEVAPNLGIAVGTDGVGSKLIVAEQTGRYDTVGIDCIAMNVNDVICVGAEPFAVLDYLAVERADEDVMRAIGVGLKEGAEQAGVEIPGGEVAVLPELIRGHPSPGGFDLTAACFGTVALDGLVTGARCEPGDALIGLPSSGIHSNGYSLARRVLGALDYDDRPAELGGATVADALLEPTVIYVRAVLELLRSDCDVRGLAHITGGGLLNLLRLHADIGFDITDPLPVPGVFDLIRRLGGVGEPELWEVFNMGCGFCVVVPPASEAAAVSLLARHHPGARRVGTITGDVDRLAVPQAGVVGDPAGLRAA